MSLWSDENPEKYNPNTTAAGQAREISSTANRAYDINASNAAGADVNNYNQVRGQQLGLAQMLNSAAQGQGPSGAGMAAQAQRDSALSQAAALQAGRRGSSAAAGARMATGAASAGNQQAAQGEAIGRANEMAGARGQLAGVLGQVGGQDIGVAQMGQQSNQFNASQNQNAALANQAAQLGISVQELQARQHQQDMLYGNLKPGSAAGWKGALGSAAQIGGAAAAFAADGAVYAPKFAAEGSGYNPYSQSTMGIGSRVTPQWNQPDAASTIIGALAGGVGTYLGARNARKKDEQEAKFRRDMAFNSAPISTSIDMSNGYDPFAHRMSSAPAAPGNFTPRTSELMTGQLQPPNMYGHGGVVDKPTLAIIGEAGPEAIVPLSDPKHRMAQATDDVRQGDRLMDSNPSHMVRTLAASAADMDSRLRKLEQHPAMGGQRSQDAGSHGLFEYGPMSSADMGPAMAPSARIAGERHLREINARNRGR